MNTYNWYEIVAEVGNATDPVKIRRAFALLANMLTAFTAEVDEGLADYMVVYNDDEDPVLNAEDTVVTTVVE